MEIPHETVGGFEIPALGLGTWKLKGDRCESTVREALELGYRHIDTAAMYDNEEAVGRGIEKVPREDLFLTTKVWRNSLSYKDFKDSTYRSLEKLDTDYLDLLLVHWPNSSVPLEETARAMDELADEEVVRHLGVSNFTADLLSEIGIISDHPIRVNQVEFHIGVDQIDILNYAREEGKVITAYAPLGKGQVIDYPKVRGVAEKYHRSPAQIALRWVVQQENVIAIPKASSSAHLEENMKVFEWSLEKADMERLSAVQTGRQFDPSWAPW